jgi:hypothetical protein
LLEKLAALVPLPRLHQGRYGGCLAPHSHLRAAIIPTPRQQGLEAPDDRRPSPHWTWARLLKRVFAMDMARGPVCPQGWLRIIAAITEVHVIQKMLRHLKLAVDPPPIAPAPQVAFAWDCSSPYHAPGPRCARCGPLSCAACSDTPSLGTPSSAYSCPALWLPMTISPLPRPLQTPLQRPTACLQVAWSAPRWFGAAPAPWRPHGVTTHGSRSPSGGLGRRGGAGEEKGLWNSFYVAAVVKPHCTLFFFPLLFSLIAVTHGPDRSGGLLWR